MDTKEKHWMVSTEQHGTRLDVFLAQCDPMLSRNEARRQIDAGSIWINGRRSRKMSRYMQKGERVTLRPEPLAQQPASSATTKQTASSETSATAKQPATSEPFAAAARQPTTSDAAKQMKPTDDSSDSSDSSDSNSNSE